MVMPKAAVSVGLWGRFNTVVTTHAPVICLGTCALAYDAHARGITGVGAAAAVTQEAQDLLRSNHALTMGTRELPVDGIPK